MIHPLSKTIHLPAADADPEDDWSKLVLVHLPSLTGMVKPLQVSSALSPTIVMCISYITFIKQSI